MNKDEILEAFDRMFKLDDYGSSTAVQDKVKQFINSALDRYAFSIVAEAATAALQVDKPVSTTYEEAAFAVGVSCTVRRARELTNQPLKQEPQTCAKCGRPRKDTINNTCLNVCHIDATL